MDKKIKIQKKGKISDLMKNNYNTTEEDKKKLEEFSKLPQIIKLRNNDNDQVRIIIDKKNKNNEINVTEKNDNFQEYIDELKDLTSKIDDEKRDFMKNTGFVKEFIEIVFNAFTSDKYYEKIEIKDTNINNLFKIFQKSEDKKYKNVTYYTFDPIGYKNSKIYYNKKYILYFLSFIYIYKNLEKNGNLIMTLQWNISKFIDLIYLGTLLFEEVYILDRGMTIFKNFKNDIKYLNLLFDIIKNKYSFKVENKKDENKIINDLKKRFYYDLYFKKNLIINNKKKLYISYLYISDIIYIKNFDLEKMNLKKLYQNLENTYKKLLNSKNIQQKNNFITNNKNSLVLDIFNNDFNILFDLIKKNNLKSCLEVGYIYNFLSKIVEDKSDVVLLSINTNKTNKKNIKSSRYEIINDTALNVYNKLYQNNKKFDFIYLNDKYNFDFILFFFIYSDKILNKDGFIIINNSHLNAVSYCVKYIELNFPSYKKIGFHTTMTIFKKINDESRDPYFFIPF